MVRTSTTCFVGCCTTCACATAYDQRRADAAGVVDRAGHARCRPHVRRTSEPASEQGTRLLEKLTAGQLRKGLAFLASAARKDIFGCFGIR